MQPLPKLGSHVADLNRLLEENERRRRRERLTLIRVWEELRGLGYEGGYDAVRRYARRWQRARDAQVAEAYVPLSFPPGEAYQFDWSHEVVVLAGVTTVVKVAHVRLCHSRMLFVRAYPREAQEMVFDAHDRAFAFFRGACQARHLRQHEDGGGRRSSSARSGPSTGASCRCEPLSGGADGVHAGGRLGEGAGREPGGEGAPAVLLAAAEVQELRGAQRLAARSLRGACAKEQAHPEQKEKTVFEVFEAERAALIPYRGPFDGFRATVGVGVQDLPGAVRQQQVLGDGEGGWPAGRHPCLCRSHRHQAGRGDRWRARSPLRQAPDRLRSLALRAGAGAQARRAAQRCSLQGLDAAGGAGEGAAQARRLPRMATGRWYRSSPACSPTASGCRGCMREALASGIASADVILNILARSQAPAPASPVADTGELAAASTCRSPIVPATTI